MVWLHASAASFEPEESPFRRYYDHIHEARRNYHNDGPAVNTTLYEEEVTCPVCRSLLQEHEIYQLVKGEVDAYSL